MNPDPLRPPETDADPDIEAHRHLRLIALVALTLAIAAVFAVRGAS